MIVTKGSLAVPSATVRLRFYDGETVNSMCLSPARVIEVVSDAAEAGLVVEGIFWTGDDSILVSQSAIPDFLALDPLAARGWLGVVWSAKLQEFKAGDANKQWVVSIGGNGRGTGAGDSEDHSQKASVECKLCKFMIHFVLIPLAAALAVEIGLDLVSHRPSAAPAPELQTCSRTNHCTLPHK